MSLINDALKNAQRKRAREPGSAVATPALVPTTEVLPRHWKLAPVATLAALGIFVGGLWLGRSSQAHQTASVRSSAVYLASLQPPPHQVRLTRSNIGAERLEQKSDAAMPTRKALPRKPDRNEPARGATATAPLNLQAIYYRLKKPSVRINGQTLFSGDQIAGAKVLSIERQSVELLVDGRTNVLRLL